MELANQLVGKAFASGLFIFADADLNFDQPQAEVVFNRLSTDGRLIFKQLLAEWQGIGSSLAGILKEHRRGTSRSLLAGS